MHGREDRDAALDGELDGDEADASEGAVDQQGLASYEVDCGERLPSGQSGQWEVAAVSRSTLSGTRITCPAFRTMCSV